MHWGCRPEDGSGTAGSSAPAQPAALQPRADPVVVVGSGPAGLFAALQLAEAGLPVVLLERGQPVERRGRDIGALFARSQLDRESNLCFGEGESSGPPAGRVCFPEFRHGLQPMAVVDDDKC